MAPSVPFCQNFVPFCLTFGENSQKGVFCPFSNIRGVIILDIPDIIDPDFEISKKPVKYSNNLSDIDYYERILDYMRAHLKHMPGLNAVILKIMRNLNEFPIFNLKIKILIVVLIHVKIYFYKLFSFSKNLFLYYFFNCFLFY